MYFIDEINNDIQWRMSELASLKSIPLRYNLMPHHREMLIKYTIPSIYALWEGFVRNSFDIYIREINKLNLAVNDVHINLITHTISSCEKLYLENPRLNFKSKKEFVEFYQDTISKPLVISRKIPTKSNVDFNVINDILLRFNLESLPADFDSKLKKLLQFRNSIAHGETSIPVKQVDIAFFSSLVNDLMIEIIIRLEYGYKNNTFKK